ncbi:adenylate/guanylate cyclase domain-containing protein [Propionispira raffinosivorans]|uniref:adenylate/guanylate cyclase domain-containing protein n=1 Tax=Propionispira raffinosivorans TaxID=86959 RepID=UPI00036C456F|nr:adenylate/guanylate cyclase domain-containing protein [Propionispira raffinosivorans]
MDKTCGFHFYVNIKNIVEIINGDEGKNDDLKRSIHRLHTYFCGLTKVVRKYGGTVEKFTNGRCHIFLEKNETETDGNYKIRINDLLVATMYFSDDIFNSIPKYKDYTRFKVQAGLDYGEFYKYDIEGLDEFTTIGAVANVAAKLTSFSLAKEIYITDGAREQLAVEDKKMFESVDESKAKEIQECLKGSPSIYYSKYMLLNKRDEVTSFLETIREEYKALANSVNLSEIEFEDARTKIDFKQLSLKKNKQITAGILFADIRGFTKLFNVSGNNLDNLKLILVHLYKKMNSAVEKHDGVRVQFQGDRIVAVFNKTYSQRCDEMVRMFEAALEIKAGVKEISDKYADELNNKQIKVGIGLCYGEFYATCLGTRGHKDKLVLGRTASSGDVAEDQYALHDEIVLSKECKEQISKIAEETLPEGIVIEEKLEPVSTTGFYRTNIDESTYKKEVKDVELELRTVDENKKSAIAMTNVMGVNAKRENVVRPHRR